MDGLVTWVYLNVLPLGSYEIVIKNDFSKAHRENIDCYNKTFECLDEEGNLRVVKGFPKVNLGRMSSTMQLEKFYGKGRRVYVAHVLEIAENGTPRLEGFHIYRKSGMLFLMKF